MDEFFSGLEKVQIENDSLPAENSTNSPLLIKKPPNQENEDLQNAEEKKKLENKVEQEVRIEHNL